MAIIGITGGIGSGKSYICDKIRLMDFPVFDADKESKNLLTSSEEVKKKIILLLGEQAYTENGVNRAFIANEIFSHPEKKQKIEQILHPMVIANFKKWVKEKKEQGSRLIFIESALIFEINMDALLDEVWLVVADEETRIERIVRRDNTTPENAQKRIAAQLSDKEKIQRANSIISNNPHDDVNAQLLQLVTAAYNATLA